LNCVCVCFACATGVGEPTVFQTGDSSPSYDAGSRGVATLSAGDGSGTYSPAGTDSYDASGDDAPDDGGGIADDAGSFAPDASSVATPSVGDLVITEIMFDPSGPIPQAQWFEVYNLTASPELLSGLTIVDGWGDAQVIDSTVPAIAPPFTYVVLVRDRGTAASNGIPDASIVYEYGAGLPSDQGIELASDATGDLALYGGGVQLVDVPYGPWGIAFPGQSIELGPLQYAGGDQPGNWCVAQLSWAAGSDDGTPGFASDCP
jgi:hypothetical protein